MEKIAIVFALLLSTLTPDIATGQELLTASLKSCNSLEVQRLPEATISRSAPISSYVYTLERMIGKSVWASETKISNNLNFTYFDRLSEGFYRVKLSVKNESNPNWSLLFSNVVEVKKCEVREEKFAQEQYLIELSPNPALDVVHIVSNSINGESLISVYNFTGQQALSIPTTHLSGYAAFSVATLTTGIYWVVIAQDGICIARKKIVIQ